MLVDKTNADTFHPELFLPLCQWAAANDAWSDISVLSQLCPSSKVTFDSVKAASHPTLHLQSEPEWRTPVFPLLNIHHEASVRRALVDFRRYTTVRTDTEMPSRIGGIVPRLRDVCRKVYGTEVVFPRVHTLELEVYDTGTARPNPRFAADQDLAALCAMVAPRRLSVRLVDEGKYAETAALQREDNETELRRLVKDLRLAIGRWRTTWPGLQSVTLYGVPLSDLASFTTPGVRNDLYVVPTPAETAAGVTVKAFVDGMARGMVEAPAGNALWRDEKTSWRVFGAMEALQKISGNEKGQSGRPQAAERKDMARQVEKDVWQAVWWQIMWSGSGTEGKRHAKKAIDREMVKRAEESGRLRFVVDRL